jgi:para-nitrobenzyl esterase
VTDFPGKKVMLTVFNRIVLLVTASFISILAFAQLPENIRITTGLIAGEAASNSDVTVYRGIPYAAPPIGDNRWRAPQPPASWSGVRPATAFGPRCVQGGFAPGAEQERSSEDCLYLNVWTPAKSQDELYPTMLWIHGGGFRVGSGNGPQYDAQHLAAKGAVVVTFNYRLGTFGFFAHPELTAESPNNASGNYAMLDAIAALEWIYDNISAFGGDPTNVTVFGESAGAVAVSALISSPLSLGLIHRAILQSRADDPVLGYTAQHQLTLAEAEQAGLSQMREFGAANLAGLRAASSQEIYENFPANGSVNVDGWFLPKSIFQTFYDGEQHPVYLMAGTNRDEANFFGMGIPNLATYRDAVNTLYGDRADDFLALYPASDDTSANAMGKQAFNDEMAFLARAMAGNQAEWGFESYVYFFTRVPPGTSRGATHVSELAYVFNQHDQHPEWTDADRALADAMASYWVSFARSSRASGPGLPAWPGFTGNEPGNVMVLGEEFGAETEMVPSAEKIQFFEDIHFDIFP